VTIITINPVAIYLATGFLYALVVLIIGVVTIIGVRLLVESPDPDNRINRYKWPASVWSAGGRVAGTGCESSGCGARRERGRGKGCGAGFAQRRGRVYSILT